LTSIGTLQSVEKKHAIWAGYFAEVDQYDQDMLDLRFELMEHINRDEWSEIFSQD